MDRAPILRVWLPLIAGLWGLGAIFLFGTGPHGPARVIGLLLGLIGLGGVIPPVTRWAGLFLSLPKRRRSSRMAFIRVFAIRFTFAQRFFLSEWF